jgi:1-acyl-sn-glycerol-3-phosphate acyltransferase
MPEKMIPPDPEKDPRNQKKYQYEMTPVRAFLTPLGRWLLPLIAKVDVEGVENLPAEGSVILASNHVTNFDVLPIQLCLTRPIFFMGKAELFQNPVLDFGFRQFGAFPVYRGLRDDWAILHAGEVLKHGQVLGMFPEGRRSRQTGLSPAKTGTARLAIGASCPILPAALTGTRQMFRHFPRRSEVKLRFGELIWPEKNETALSLTDRLMFSIGVMLPPELRGAYTYHPEDF